MAEPEALHQNHNDFRRRMADVLLRSEEKLSSCGL